MNRSPFSISPPFRDFVEHIRTSHLEAVAQDYLRRIRSFDVPFLRLVSQTTEAELLNSSIVSMDKFLASLTDGTALVAAAENLRQWEADEIPGFSRTAFGARDVVLVGAAQEAAILNLLEHFTQDASVALKIVREVRNYFLQAELNAYEVFTRIRMEEMQMSNEELEAQHEELIALNEEMSRQASALAEQTAFVENLVRHVPTGIAYMDKAQIFRWVNPEFASFARMSVHEFDGRSFYDVFPHMENPNPRLLAVLESGEPAEILGLAIHQASGTTYWDIVYVPVCDRQGTIDGLMLMSQDASERVRNEQLQQRQIDQLQEVDRLKNDFLSILSHELRTPINAIMGFASILEDEVSGPLNKEQSEYLHRILRGADVLLGLIEDLLDLSRIQAGKFSLRLEPCEPGSVVEESVGALSPLAGQRGQTISLGLETDGTLIQADAQRLRQIITNLVGNAIKFGPESDTLLVRARTSVEGLYCEVEDHGDGIAEADMARLFQRFSQLHGGNSRKAGGAGLGLSIVKAVVEAHGGEVGVRSQPGERTVFWFTLPTVAPVATHSIEVH